MTKHDLTVTGMHCGGCVRRVTAALHATKNVTDVEVAVGKVTFSAPADVLAVDGAIRAIEALGFQVVVSVA
jgi:copper chaperone